MPDLLVPLPDGHDPFADAPSTNQWGQPLVRDVSPEERYRFQGDVPAAVKRAAMGEHAYQTLRRGQAWAGRSWDMTPDQREAYDHGLRHASYALAGLIHPAFAAAGFGLDAVDALQKGDTQGALESAATMAVPVAAGQFPKTAAAAAGAFLGNPATATGGGLIDSLLPAERAAFADRLKQANRIRDRDQRNAEISKINGEMSTLVSGRATTEARMANDKQAADDWLKNNEASIKSLPTERAAAVRGAAPGDRAAMLSKFLEDKRIAGMTTAEKYADYLDPARYAILGLSGAVPAKMAFGRAGDLRTATTRAAAAWNALKTGRTTAAKEGELLAARNNLAQKSTLSPMDAREMALGATVPYGATVFGPNAIDVGKNAGSIPVPTWLGGSGESARTEDWEKTKRALFAMGAGAPWPIIEGVLGAGGGTWAGGAARDFGSIKKGARGTLDTINPAADAIAKKEAQRVSGGRQQKQSGALTAGPASPQAGVLSAAPMGPPAPLTPAAAASKYPDWATTRALKRKYTIDQKKAAAAQDQSGVLTAPVSAPAPQAGTGKKKDLAPDAVGANPLPQQFRGVKLDTPSGKTDETGLWFLDGNKPVFAQASPQGATNLLGERAKELTKYGSVSGKNANGSPITVWYKPGEEDRARRVVELFSKADNSAQYHIENGRALGYPEAAIQKYVQAREAQGTLSPLPAAKRKKPNP